MAIDENTEVVTDVTVLDGTETADTSGLPAELITIAQLPIINEELERVKAIIDQRTQAALELECTNENRKEIKAIRAEFNKERAELDRRYKEAMDEVLAPAYVVQAKYKECTQGYITADKELKAKIAVVEDTLKNEKIVAVQAYFEELAQAKGIDFISFEQMGLKIGLSNSEKSLKKEVDTFLGRVACDLQMIDTHEYADEILLEYKQNGFNCSQAVTSVTSRKKRIEEERKRRLAAQADEEKKRMAEQAALQAAQEAQEESAPQEGEAEVLQPPTAETVVPEAHPESADENRIVIVNLNLGRYRAPLSKIKKLKKVIFDFIETEGGFEKL